MPRIPFGLLLAACVIGLHAENDPMNSERVRAIMRHMEKTSTWYHDDLFGEFSGFRFYARHRYADALHYFKIGAYYADKPSQISIGLMYLNGEGVHSDPVMAFAWIDLAAERGYPAYVATRERVRATLSQDQLAQAQDARRTLATKYGDDVAKPRIANELRSGIRQMTGSRAGFDNGVRFLPLDEVFHSGAGSPGMMDARTICEQGFWAKACWQPELYFAMRDRQLNATVTVGAVEEQK